MNAVQEIRQGTRVVCIKEVYLTPDFTMKPSEGEGRVANIDWSTQIASVKYQVPDLPLECKECGRISGLMFNRSIGQVECFITGCGRRQGFKTVSASIHLSLLKEKE